MFIEGLLADTIDYSTISAVDSDGVFTYAAPVSVKAKVREMDELITGGDSQDARYRAEIITLAEIKRDDRVWLPGDSSADTDLAHTPVSVESVKSLNSDIPVYKVRL